MKTPIASLQSLIESKIRANIERRRENDDNFWMYSEDEGDYINKELDKIADFLISIGLPEWDSLKRDVENVEQNLNSLAES